jgi:succinoglycan biosynthesis protein ExoA
VTPVAPVAPLVSVVMPVRNEEAHIGRTVAAVLAQDYPADRLEVLVADGRSADGTRDVLAHLAARDGRLKVIDNPGRIVATGLNAAIRQSRGEIVVRVDGHTEIEAGYVRACAEALSRTGADNVGGRMTAVGSGAFGRAVAAATSSQFGVGGARFHYSDREEWVDTVYLGAWRREIFDRIGGFDEELVRDQDDEFNYRLRAAGGRILLSPAVRSRYTVRGTPRSLFRQYFQYGFWKVRVLQKHPRQMRLRQFVPPLFVLALIATSALALAFPAVQAASLSVLGLAAIYLLADAAAAVVETRRQGASPALLALVFPILHVAYGAGFLVGLVRFVGRWGGGETTPAAHPVARRLVPSPFAFSRSSASSPSSTHPRPSRRSARSTTSWKSTARPLRTRRTPSSSSRRRTTDWPSTGRLIAG